MGETIEDSIFRVILPVNTIPILERIKELLSEKKTNSIIGLKDDRIDKCLMLLLLQRYDLLDGHLWERWKIEREKKDSKNRKERN